MGQSAQNNFASKIGSTYYYSQKKTLTIDSAYLLELRKVTGYFDQVFKVPREPR